MELTVKQENLTKAFNIIGKIASNRTSLAILNNVLLQTNGSRLMIAATNLEIAVSQNIGAKVEKVGSITVPAKLVSEFIASLPRGNVKLKVEGEHLLIEGGGSKSKINGVSAEDFPELPSVNRENAVKINIPAGVFKEAIDQTVVTASVDTSRPILNGVFWHSFEGYLYLAATDGYRLSEKKLFTFEENLEAVVPASSLMEAVRAMNDNTEEVEVLFDEDMVEFRLDDIVVVSRLIDGKFVEYRRLIPSGTETNTEISRQDFQRIIKIAALFARDSGGSIVLKANEEEQKLSIYSIASEFGENTSEAEAKISGGGEVALNPNYLMKAVSVIGGSKVSFGFSGKLAPTVLKNPDDDDYIHIIMPLKS